MERALTIPKSRSELCVAGVSLDPIKLEHSNMPSILNDYDRMLCVLNSSFVLVVGSLGCDSVNDHVPHFALVIWSRLVNLRYSVCVRQSVSQRLFFPRQIASSFSLINLSQRHRETPFPSTRISVSASALSASISAVSRCA